MIGILLPMRLRSAKERLQRGMRASLDVRDRLAHRERLGDRDATLGAELVVLQAKRRVVTNQNDQKVESDAVTKCCG
jgi:hypothetical protein